MISAVAILCTISLCLFGIVYDRYSDNFAQRLGLSLLLVGYIPRFLTVLETHENRHAFIDVGIAIFAIGTAYKVWKHHKDPVSDQPIELTPDEAKQVYGGHK